MLSGQASGGAVPVVKDELPTGLFGDAPLEEADASLEEAEAKFWKFFKYKVSEWNPCHIEEDGRVFTWRDKDGFRVAMVHFGNNQCVVDPTRHSTVNTEIGCSNPESSLADFMLKPFEKQTGRLETETLGVGT